MRKSIGMTTDLILSALLALSACTPAAGSAGRVTDAELAAGRVSSAFDKALVITAAGTVEAGSAGAFRPITGGDFLAGGETVRTGEGASCELQLGTTAVIRVEERTEVRLDELILKPQAAAVGVRLGSGTLLCKVERLAANERFRVRTKAAACGVRGTEFAVTADSAGDTTLAVGKGEVAFWSAPDKLDELKEKTVRIDVDFALVFDAVEDFAIIVGANQQADLTGKQAEGAYKNAGSALEKLEGAQVLSQEQKTSFMADLMQDAVEMKKSAAVRSADDAERRLLERIKGMWTVPIAGPGEEENGAAAKIQAKPLVLITVAADTADTEIYLDGNYLGQGMFQSIFPDGRILELRFSRPGFQDMLLSLPVKAAGHHSFGVKLLPLDPTAQSDGFQNLLRPGETAVLWQSFEGENDWRTGYDIWGDAGGPQSAVEVKASTAFATHGKKSLEAVFAMRDDLIAATVGTEKVGLDWGAYRAILVDVKNTSAETVWIVAVLQEGDPDWSWYQAKAPDLPPGEGATLRFDMDKFILTNASAGLEASHSRVLSDYKGVARFFITFGAAAGKRGSIDIDNLRLVKGE